MKPKPSFLRRGGRAVGERFGTRLIAAMAFGRLMLKGRMPNQEWSKDLRRQARAKSAKFGVAFTRHPATLLDLFPGVRRGKRP